ncbi:MAG TPA: phosphatase PAP2 family protein [Ktedonobacteraceae bacterium]|jgi:membrane-associated phospholipid phosphatase|nr:phosphatase PAP2 family protein [Ktedonobacteraceae bacterium]
MAQKQKKEDSMEELPTGTRLGNELGSVISEAEKEVSGSRRSWYESVRWGRILITADAILLALFALLAWWVHIHPILAIDVAITREFQENQSPWLSATMAGVSYIGNTLPLQIGLIVLAAALFALVRLYLEAVTVIVVSAVDALLNISIKLLVDRPRPNSHLVDVLQHANGLSFPSGHVMSYVAFWGLLFSFGVILFKGNYWWRIALLVISALFVVLVGPSRIYLGDHWASDVLGGYIFAGVWLCIALLIYFKLNEKSVLASRKRGSFLRKYMRQSK